MLVNPLGYLGFGLAQIAFLFFHSFCVYVKPMAVIVATSFVVLLAAAKAEEKCRLKNLLGADLENHTHTHTQARMDNQL